MLVGAGCYDDFELSNENDELEQFLKMAPPPEPEAPAKEEAKAEVWFIIHTNSFSQQSISARECFNNILI